MNRENPPNEKPSEGLDDGPSEPSSLCHCPFDKLRAVSLSNREEERRGNPPLFSRRRCMGAAGESGAWPPARRPTARRDCFGRRSLPRNDKKVWGTWKN